MTVSPFVVQFLRRFEKWSAAGSTTPARDMIRPSVPAAIPVVDKQNAILRQNRTGETN